ncbi:MAG: hypothetical protein AABM30_11575 [Actinomycetota bacterium]
MLLRFAIFAAVIATALGVAQQKQVLQNAHLTGYCTQIATPVGQTGFWHECRSGKLTGTPGLSRGSCARASHAADRDIWRCPTALEANQTRQ